jgi:hypothetical protein
MKTIKNRTQQHVRNKEIKKVKTGEMRYCRWEERDIRAREEGWDGPREMGGKKTIKNYVEKRKAVNLQSGPEGKRREKIRYPSMFAESYLQLCFINKPGSKEGDGNVSRPEGKLSLVP